MGKEKMLSKSGILILIAGFFTAVFSGISGFMESSNIWVDLTLSTLMGDDLSNSLINFTDVDILQDLLYYLIVDLPLAGFLIGLGVILLIFSLFFKNH
jgi:hypothetical protein